MKCRNVVEDIELSAAASNPELEEVLHGKGLTVLEEGAARNEGVESDRATAFPAGEDESQVKKSTAHHFWGPIVRSALGVLLALIIIGTLVMHFRMEWPWEYSLYWTVVTAFTVGYGDSPAYKYACHDVELNYTNETEGYIYDANNLTYTAEVCETSHRAITDRPFDMLFVMVFACATVACATTLLTEFLER